MRHSLIWYEKYVGDGCGSLEADDGSSDSVDSREKCGHDFSIMRLIGVQPTLVEDADRESAG